MADKPDKGLPTIKKLLGTGNQMSLEQRLGQDMPGGPRETRSVPVAGVWPLKLNAAKALPWSAEKAKQLHRAARGMPKDAGSGEIPAALSALSGRIMALGRSIGLPESKLISLMPPTDDRGYEGNPELHYDALVRLHDFLDTEARKLGKAGMASRMDAQSAIPEEDPFGLGSGFNPTEINRAPEGVVASKRNIEEKKEERPWRKTEAIPRKPEFTREETVQKGFLSDAARKQIMAEMEKGILEGRDTSSDAFRTKWLMGQGMGGAIASIYGGGSGQLGAMGRSIGGFIDKQWDRTDAEFGKPEARRKARMSELLNAMQSDRGIAALLKSSTDSTYAIDGKSIDPETADLFPQGFLEAATQELTKANPKFGNLASQFAALGVKWKQEGESLKVQQQIAKIALTYAQARAANAKGEKVPQYKVQEMAKEMEAKLYAALESGEADETTPGVNPLTNTPDLEWLKASAERRIREGGASTPGIAGDEGIPPY